MMTNTEAVAIVRRALRTVLDQGAILEEVDRIELALDILEHGVSRP